MVDCCIDEKKDYTCRDYVDLHFLPSKCTISRQSFRRKAFFQGIAYDAVVHEQRLKGACLDAS